MLVEDDDDVRRYSPDAARGKLRVIEAATGESNRGDGRYQGASIAAHRCHHAGMNGRKLAETAKTRRRNFCS